MVPTWHLGKWNPRLKPIFDHRSQAKPVPRGPFREVHSECPAQSVCSLWQWAATARIPASVSFIAHLSRVSSGFIGFLGSIGLENPQLVDQRVQFLRGTIEHHENTRCRMGKAAHAPLQANIDHTPGDPLNGENIHTRRIGCCSCTTANLFYTLLYPPWTWVDQKGPRGFVGSVESPHMSRPN